VAVAAAAVARERADAAGRERPGLAAARAPGAAAREPAAQRARAAGPGERCAERRARAHPPQHGDEAGGAAAVAPVEAGAVDEADTGAEPARLGAHERGAGGRAARRRREALRQDLGDPVVARRQHRAHQRRDGRGAGARQRDRAGRGGAGARHAADHDPARLEHVVEAGGRGARRIGLGRAARRLGAALERQRRQRAAELGVERAVAGRAGAGAVEARLVADDRAGHEPQSRQPVRDRRKLGVAEQRVAAAAQDQIPVEHSRGVDRGGAERLRAEHVPGPEPPQRRGRGQQLRRRAERPPPLRPQRDDGPPRAEVGDLHGSAPAERPHGALHVLGERRRGAGGRGRHEQRGDERRERERPQAAWRAGTRTSPRSCSASAIWTAFVAAPLSRLSLTIHMFRQRSCDGSRRIRPTSTSSRPAPARAVG
jgi:hypothetical protein